MPSQDVELQMQRRVLEHVLLEHVLLEHVLLEHVLLEHVLLEHVQHSVPDYWCWSVLNMIFCCLPFGVVALRFSRRVSKKMVQRDVEFAGARTASEWALACNVLSLITGIGCWIYIVNTYSNTFNQQEMVL